MAGFIKLSNGSFTPDPGSAITHNPTTQLYETAEKPVLVGDGDRTYDAAFRRWLPVAHGLVLSDGSAYVYTAATATQLQDEIHVVDVATGVDRVVFNQGAYAAIAFLPEGIYLIRRIGSDSASGLWLLDPSSGSLKAFPEGSSAWWGSIAGGAAWSYSADGNRFGSNSLLRMDLSSGHVSTWFSVASPVPPPQSGFEAVRAIGFDGAMNPLVQVGVDQGVSQLWIATAPGQAVQLSGMRVATYIVSTGVTDSRGTWLNGADGIYLYNSSGMKLAAAGGYTVVGGCV